MGAQLVEENSLNFGLFLQIGRVICVIGQTCVSSVRILLAGRSKSGKCSLVSKLK